MPQQHHHRRHSRNGHSHRGGGPSHRGPPPYGVPPPPFPHYYGPPPPIEIPKYKENRLKEAYHWDEKVLLGSGTFGQVFQVKERTTSNLFAIKALNKKRSTYLPERIKQEIEILSHLRHPNIIQLIETIDTDDCLYLVYEYAKHDLMGLLNAPSYLFKHSDVKNIMIQLLEGIRFIHDQNIIHRDIKPANILINERGEVKIADFGLATKNHNREKSAVVCTLWYRPIELCLCEKVAEYGTEIDLWSVGVVFAELLRKTKKFEGNPALFRTDDPMQLVDMVLDFVGTPPHDKAIRYLEKLPLFKRFDWKRTRRCGLRKEFTQTREAANLLNWFLQLYPRGRPSAGRALQKSDYFKRGPPPSPVLTLPPDQCNERIAKIYLQKAGLLHPSNSKREDKSSHNRNTKNRSNQIPPDSNKLNAATTTSASAFRTSSSRKRSRESLNDSDGGSESGPSNKRARASEGSSSEAIETNPRFLPSTGSRISPSVESPIGVEFIVNSKPAVKVLIHALSGNFPVSVLKKNKTLSVAHQLTKAQYEDWKKNNSKCTAHKISVRPMSSDGELERFHKFSSTLRHEAYYIKNTKIMMCVEKQSDKSSKEMRGILFLK